MQVCRLILAKGAWLFGVFIFPDHTEVMLTVMRSDIGLERCQGRWTVGIPG